METFGLHVSLLRARIPLRNPVRALSGIVLRAEFSGNDCMDYRGTAVGRCSRHQQFLLRRSHLSADHGAEAISKTRTITV